MFLNGRKADYRRSERRCHLWTKHKNTPHSDQRETAWDDPPLPTSNRSAHPLSDENSSERILKKPRGTALWLHSTVYCNFFPLVTSKRLIYCFVLRTFENCWEPTSMTFRDVLNFLRVSCNWPQAVCPGSNFVQIVPRGTFWRTRVVGLPYSWKSETGLRRVPAVNSSGSLDESISNFKLGLSRGNESACELGTAKQRVFPMRLFFFLKTF